MQVFAMQVGAMQNNCYVAWKEGADGCVVIDPGGDGDLILEQVLKKGKQVEAILLTHGHFDHVGGVGAIYEAAGCRVYLHKKELEQPDYMTAGPLLATHYYDEGDILCLGGLEIRVLHTPGHTPGSVCLMCEDTLFTGDTLFAGTCGRTDFPGGSYSQMQESLRRLAALEGDYRVLPGHEAQTTLERERKNNPFMG